MSVLDPSYVVLGTSDVSAFVFTAGSRGLWLVDIYMPPESGASLCRIASMSDDGVSVPVTTLHEGAPGALSTCVGNPTECTASVYLGQWSAPAPKFYPIYVAPSSTLFVGVAAGGIVYLNEG